MSDPFQKMINADQLFRFLAIGSAGGATGVEKVLRMLYPVVIEGKLIDMKNHFDHQRSRANLGVAVDTQLSLGSILLDFEKWLVAGKLLSSSANAGGRYLIDLMLAMVRINDKWSKSGNELRIFPRKDEKGAMELVVGKSQSDDGVIEHARFCKEVELMQTLRLFLEDGA